MKKFLIGTGIMIASGVSALIVRALNLPHASVLGWPLVVIGCVGFGLQMQCAFSMKRQFDGQLKAVKDTEREHVAFMKRISTLPSAEADQLIIQRLDELLK
jgi:hypothetical protein